MKYLIILLIFAIITLLLKIAKNTHEHFNNVWMWFNGKPNGGIGNILSYFFYMKINNVINNKQNTNSIDKEYKYYINYNNLDKSLVLSDNKIIELKKYFSKIRCNPDSFWNITNYVELVPIYNIIYHDIKKSLNLFLKNIDVPKIEKIPIIHFRCSDVPFDIHNDYNFSKYSFYKRCNEKLKHKYKKWYIMTYNNHNSNNKKKKLSKEYFDDLIKYLRKDLNLEIEILKPNEPIKDLKLLHNSPAVIAGGCGGSFSFFGGYFSNAFFFSDNNSGNTVEPKLDNLKYQFYYPGYKLSHEIVKKNGGYENTKNIFKLLIK